jgi:heme A synthase
MIEIGHRWAAALVSAVVAAMAGVAWLKHRQDPFLRNPATLALVVLIVQVLLGAVTVKLELPPAVVIVHLANAMVLLAVILVTAAPLGYRHRIATTRWYLPPQLSASLSFYLARRLPTFTPACCVSVSRSATAPPYLLGTPWQCCHGYTGSSPLPFWPPS